ncbi:MAG: metal-dependent hydrolase [Caldilineaceae bacterium]
MQPHKHLALSALIGAAGWWWTGEATTGALALAVGVLPDVDHVVDYLVYHRSGEHKLVLLLHGYEYALLAGTVAFTSSNPALAIATLSYLVHLFADQFENHTHWLGYSFLFRAIHRFRIEEISNAPEAAKRGRMQDMAMVRKLLRGFIHE